MPTKLLQAHTPPDFQTFLRTLLHENGILHKQEELQNSKCMVGW